MTDKSIKAMIAESKARADKAQAYATVCETIAYLQEYTYIRTSHTKASMLAESDILGNLLNVMDDFEMRQQPDIGDIYYRLSGWHCMSEASFIFNPYSTWPICHKAIKLCCKWVHDNYDLKSLKKQYK